MPRDARSRFALGFTCGIIISIALNLLPYWQSYGAYNGDGYEVIGFPLIFRRDGGFVPTHEFHVGPLLIDGAVAVAIACVLGLAAVKLPMRFGRHRGRGFPIVEKSDV